MTYRRLTAIVAAALVALAAACDSKSDSSGQDAGPDTAGSESKKTQKQEESDKDEKKKRPKARADESGTLHEEPPPELDGLIEADDLKQLADGGSFGTTELPGKDPSPSYNSRRLKPKGDGGYGAGIQIWTFDKASEAQSRLGEFRSQYLNTEDVPKSKQKALGSGAFISKRGGIRNVLFSVDQPARVAAVSCSVEICDDRSKLLDLAAKIRRRVASKGASDSGGGGSNGGESEGSSDDDSK